MEFLIPYKFKKLSRDIKDYLNYYLYFVFISSMVAFKYQEDFKLVAQKMKVVGAKKLQKKFHQKK